MTLKEKLDRAHQEVPEDYYQQGIKSNIFQRFWHKRCFYLITGEIKKLNLKGRVLDLGCHSGDRTKWVLESSQAEVYGLDISQKAIAFAEFRFPEIAFVCNNFPHNSPFPDNYFEAITAFDVLEHLPDLDLVLVEIKRLLKPGGYLLAGVPNENIFWKTAWFVWTKFRGKVWQGVHLHDFKNEGFEIFLKQGFKRIREKKIIFKMWRFIIFRLEKK